MGGTRARIRTCVPSGDFSRCARRIGLASGNSHAGYESQLDTEEPRCKEARANPQKTEKHSQRKLITLLVPARNEIANLPRVYDEVSAVFAGQPYDYEVLLLDNASTDGTPRLAAICAVRDPRWRYLRLSRDFSVEGSLAAGLRMARGDAAIVLFSDLQDPPERIPDFLARWEAGHDVVYGVLEARSSRTILEIVGRQTHLSISGPIRLGTPVPPNATDFRLLLASGD